MIYPFSELIIIKRIDPDTLYVSRLIGAGDAFTVCGLNRRPWHFQREQFPELNPEPFWWWGGVMQRFKELHNEWLGLKAEGPGYG